MVLILTRSNFRSNWVGLSNRIQYIDLIQMKQREILVTYLSDTQGNIPALRKHNCITENKIKHQVLSRNSLILVQSSLKFQSRVAQGSIWNSEKYEK